MKQAMISKNGPFQVIECDGNGAVEKPVAAPLRDYDCCYYTSCLSLGAALNWDNFTCRGCAGEISQPLLWQARQAQRKDPIARQLCALPEIELHDGAKPNVKLVNIAGKR